MVEFTVVDKFRVGVNVKLMIFFSQVAAKYRFIIRWIFSAKNPSKLIHHCEFNRKQEILEEIEIFKHHSSAECKTHLLIDFTKKNSLGKLLGFSAKLLELGVIHESDLPVQIVQVRTIQINCNMTEGAFYNARPSHTLYQFAVNVYPGYAIDETPKNLIYLPVLKSKIDNITVNILDQDSNLVNFRGENIIVRFELKKWF